MSGSWLLALAALVLTTLNAVATLRVIRAPWFSRNQKTAQLLFLWLLPAVGFAFVWHFTHETAPPRVTTDLRNWLEPDEVLRRLGDARTAENSDGSSDGGGDG